VGWRGAKFRDSFPRSRRVEHVAGTPLCASRPLVAERDIANSISLRGKWRRDSVSCAIARRIVHVCTLSGDRLPGPGAATRDDLPESWEGKVIREYVGPDGGGAAQDLAPRLSGLFLGQIEHVSPGRVFQM